LGGLQNVQTVKPKSQNLAAAQCQFPNLRTHFAGTSHTGRALDLRKGVQVRRFFEHPEDLRPDYINL
jgi:hypothetical protein